MRTDDVYIRMMTRMVKFISDKRWRWES